MVVMGGLAGDVRVLAGGEVDPLNDAQLGENVQCAEDRGAADTKSALARILREVGGGEVTRSRREQGGHGTPRTGQPIAGVRDSGDDWLGITHAQMILSLK